MIAPVHNRIVRTWLAALTLAIGTGAAPLAHGEILETDDLETVLSLSEEKSAQYGPSEVLVVFDIDNTLLATPQNFGSAQWYEWQSHLIESGNFNNAVARDSQGLLRVQSQIYALSDMRPTETDTSQTISALQRSGLDVMALTARGPANRDATLRELSENGIRLGKSSPTHGASGRYLPVDPSDPYGSGLTDAEIAEFELTSPRRVSFEHGVMMVAGQHKGAMLRTILHHMNDEPEAVIFVDDKMDNVVDVETALAGTGIESVSLRYGGEDETVARFRQGDKSSSIAAWRELSSTLQKVFE